MLRVTTKKPHNMKTYRILTIIILLALTSCGSMKVNGIDVSAKHRRVMSDHDKRVYIAGAVIGFAVGTHFHKANRTK